MAGCFFYDSFGFEVLSLFDALPPELSEEDELLELSDDVELEDELSDFSLFSDFSDFSEPPSLFSFFESRLAPDADL